MPPVRGVARPTSGASDIREQSRRAVLRCGQEATIVVLARRSAPERECLAGHTTPAAEHDSARFSAGPLGLRSCSYLLRQEWNEWGTHGIRSTA
jgi:hypothetical protein